MKVSEAFERSKAVWLSQQSKSYQGMVSRSIRYFIEAVGDIGMHEVCTLLIEQYHAFLMERGMNVTSQKIYLRQFRSFLRWAYDCELIDKIPRIRYPKVPKDMQCRDTIVSPKEFDKWCASMLVVRPRDGDRFVALGGLMYRVGLRLSEALIASWDEAPWRLELKRRYPMFVIESSGQKSGKDEFLPITRKAAAWLRQTFPPEIRTGRIARLDIAREHASRLITEGMKKAGVKASAHDLRRSFGTLLAAKVRPAVLQRLMRHADIQTTMKHYVHLDAQDISRELWRLD